LTARHFLACTFAHPRYLWGSISSMVCNYSDCHILIHSHIPPNITTDILRLGTPGRRMLFTSCGLRIGHFFCLCPSMLSRCCSTLCCYPRAAHADDELLIHPPAQVATDLHPIILWVHRLFYVGLACPSLPCLQLAEQTVGLLCLASCFPLGCPGTDYNLCQDCR